MRSTRTYVTMEVSGDFYSTVWQKMVDAGYEHQIDEDAMEIDMHGIAITPSTVAARPPIPGEPEPNKILRSQDGTKFEEVGQTERGYTIFRQANGVGGHTYWSDEVGGGVVVWDTSLVFKDTLQLALNLEDKRDAEEKRASRTAPKPEGQG